MRNILLLLFVALSIASHAQYVLTGKVVDSKDNEALIGAAVTVTAAGGQPTGQISDNDGNFSVKVGAGKYTFRVAYMGYSAYEKTIDVSANQKMGTIRLKPESKDLAEVKVAGTLTRQEQRGDTTVFNAEAYKVNPDAMTEDLLKKMPGIQISGSTIKAGGEEVKKVLVDGKEFFGSDPMVALKNISADMVSKIEVYDKQSDQAQFTGFSDGNEERTINIMTKMGIQSGYFGRVYGGYGTDKHYEVGGNINIFKGEHRISFIGMLNNINQQNFSFDDVTGAMSMGGGRSMRGAFNPGQSGINRTGSVGFNYGYEKTDKLKIELSYFYNNNKNESATQSTQVYFVDADDDPVRTYDSESESESKNHNHRASMRLTWTINPMNSIIFTPSVSWQGYKSQSADLGYDAYDAETYMSTEQQDDSQTKGMSASGEVMWRHKFKVDRRTLSLKLGLSASPSNSDETSYSSTVYTDGSGDDIISSQITDNDSKSTSANASLMYTEPLGQFAALQVNYSPAYTYSYGDKTVLADTLETSEAEFGDYVFSSTLSNKKTSDYWQQKGGLGLNLFSSNGFNATLGVDFQYATLKGEQEYPTAFTTDKKFNSVLPSLMMRYKNGQKFNMRMRYRTSTSAPSISKLQEVVDVSNSRKYSAGNADLSQSYSHSLRMFFVVNNVETSRAIFMMGDLTSTLNYITTQTVIPTSDTIINNGIVLPSGVQFDKPINMDGYISARANITFSTPVSFIGSNVNLSLGTNMVRTPSVYNGRKVTSKNYAYNAGLTIGSSFSENVDFTLSYNGDYNIVKSTATSASNYNYYSHTAGADVNCLFWSRLVLTNNLSHKMTSGMGDDYDTNYFSWNAAVAWKFFRDRRGELRLKVNDILNNTESVSRSIKEAYVQTSSTEVLRRYFMLTFTYKFKPKGNAPQASDDGHRPPPPGGFGGPPPR